MLDILEWLTEHSRGKVGRWARRRTRRVRAQLIAALCVFCVGFLLGARRRPLVQKLTDKIESIRQD